jgi:hypothetical protein
LQEKLRQNSGTEGAPRGDGPSLKKKSMGALWPGRAGIIEENSNKLAPGWDLLVLLQLKYFQKYK